MGSDQEGLAPSVFHVWEEDLKDKITTGEAPFLGLFADSFRPKTRNFIVKILANDGTPVERIIQGLNTHPALFASYLAIFLSEGFGNTGYFEVYSHIARALGLPSLPECKKRKLWQAFRQACLSLGLSVAPLNRKHHQMVTEYLRQAGLPLLYVERLTDHMLHYAEDVGIPDENDPESVKVWQQGLLQRLSSSFPLVARQAVELDKDGYYLRLFLRLFSHSPLPESLSTELERKIVETINSNGIRQETLRSVAIPRLILRDFEIGVLLPQGRDTIWIIAVDGKDQHYPGHREERFVPLEATLPQVVIVREVGKDSSWTFQLWEDERDNRFLLFGPAGGRYLKSSSLADDEISAAPGEYTLLCRFEPEGVEGGIQLLSEDPSLYLWQIALRPGQSCELCRGPAKLILRADNEPAIEWIGDPVRAVRGSDIYASQGLSIRVYIPEEIRQACDTGFVISLRTASLGQEVVLPIEQIERDDIVLELSSALATWSPGLTRLLVEIRRADSQRTLIRGSAFVWNGLSFLKKRVVFFCSKLPVNLLQEESDNISVNEARCTITYRNESNRFFRLTFSDGPRKLSFTWAVPGVFLFLEKPAEDSYEERPLRVGSAIAVSLASREVVKIFASESAVIRLGMFERSVDFCRYGATRIPLAPLLEYLRPGENVLELFIARTGEIVRLVSLVSPHEVLSFDIKSEVVDSTFSASFSLTVPVEALRIVAKELLYGDELSTELWLAEGGPQQNGHFPSGGQVSSFRGEDGKYSLAICPEKWSQGLWLIYFDARISGRWGRLANARHDVYAGMLVIVEEDVVSLNTMLDNFLDKTGEEGTLMAFARVHQSLLCCYALECWNKGLSRLEWLWLKLLCQLKECRGQVIRALLCLSMAKPSDGSAASWIPMLQIGVAHPHIFCFARETYRGIQKDGNTFLSSLSCLGELVELNDLPKNNAFNIAPLVAFSSYHPVLSDFSPSKYRAALTQTDLSDRWRFLLDESWNPGPGDYLGAMHYRYSLTQLKDAYKTSLAGNDHRRGLALKLGSRANSGKLLDPSLLSTKVRAASLDLGLFQEAACFPEGSEENLMQEHLQGLVRFLCLFAGVCRLEARQPGTLGAFTRDTLAKTDFTFGDFRSALGFVLYTGEELFGFYLLLWELIYCADMEGVHA